MDTEKRGRGRPRINPEPASPKGTHGGKRPGAGRSRPARRAEHADAKWIGVHG